jgi:hypothetical protein
VERVGIKQVRLLIQQPDYRLDGKLQFVVGYTSFGAQECIHLTLEQLAERCERKAGTGKLIEIDGRFYWETEKRK